MSNNERYGLLELILQGKVLGKEARGDDVFLGSIPSELGSL